MPDGSEFALTRLTLSEVERYTSEKIFELKPGSYDTRYPKWPGMVGLELELFPVSLDTRENTAKKRMHPLFDNALGKSSSHIVAEWGAAQNYTLHYVEGHPEMLLMAESDRGDRVSFEPGGQVEISLRPLPCLGEALTTLVTIFESLKSAFLDYGVTLERAGIFTYQNADEIGLQMTKPRYLAMNDYFNRIGPYGRQMMRQTCTLQVNLDFGRTEEEMAKRLLLGFLLAPIATALFANSSVAAYAAEHPSINREVYNRRAESWRYIDPSRTGIPKGLEKLAGNWTKAACAEIYSASLLAAEVVFLPKLGYEVPQKRPFTFRDWVLNGYKDVYPTFEDLEVHASLHFLEVRARGFMEIRSCDAQSEYWQSVVPSFFVGLLYSCRSLDRAIDLLLPRVKTLEEDLRIATVEGLRNSEILSLSQKVFEIANDGIKSMATCFSTVESLERMDEFYSLKFKG